MCPASSRYSTAPLSVTNASSGSSPTARVVPSSAGLHVSCFVDRPLARDPELVVNPLAPFYLRRPRRGLALGFGLIAAKHVAEGVRRLARCLK